MRSLALAEPDGNAALPGRPVTAQAGEVVVGEKPGEDVAFAVYLPHQNREDSPND